LLKQHFLRTECPSADSIHPSTKVDPQNNTTPPANQIKHILAYCSTSGRIRQQYRIQNRYDKHN